MTYRIVPFSSGIVTAGGPISIVAGSINTVFSPISISGYSDKDTNVIIQENGITKWTQPVNALQPFFYSPNEPFFTGVAPNNSITAIIQDSTAKAVINLSLKKEFG